jgi:hypothetical protein
MAQINRAHQPTTAQANGGQPSRRNFPPDERSAEPKDRLGLRDCEQPRFAECRFGFLHVPIVYQEVVRYKDDGMAVKRTSSGGRPVPAVAVSLPVVAGRCRGSS